MELNKLFALVALLLMAKNVALQAQTASNAIFTTNDNGFANPSPDLVPNYSDWLHYDDGVYFTSLQYTPDSIPFSWAVSFPPSMLQAYEGHILTKVALYESDQDYGELNLGIYTGNSYMPLTLLSRQRVTKTVHWWYHEIELDQPVEIDVTKDLWIVFSEIEVTESFSASCTENAVNPNPNARWVQFELNKWMDVGDFGFPDIQFMIRGYVTDPWGVEIPLTNNDLNVYPNPGKETLNIRTEWRNAFVEVYDMNGKMVHSQWIMDGHTAINTENWPAGTYIWKVMANSKEVETGKWIKE